MTDQLLWYYIVSIVITFIVKSVSIWKSVVGGDKQESFAALMVFIPVANILFCSYLIHKMLCKEK
jgi:hypothetical protein